MIIQGTVITRDKIYTAHGKSQAEVRTLFEDFYLSNFESNPILTFNEFIGKIVYEEIVLGTISIQDNPDTLYKCM